MADAIEPPDLQHRIRAFKTDISLPLDDDLAKGRGAETVRAGRSPGLSRWEGAYRS